MNESSFKLIHYSRNKTRSSLSFQIALYINVWLFPIWLFITVINLDAKYNALTTIYKALTIAVFLILSICESLKLYLGYAGNLGRKIPELASCWLISIFVQLPLETFLLLDPVISSHYSETVLNSTMLSLLFIEIVTGIITLTNLADHRAKIFYLAHLYGMCTQNRC